MNEITPPNPSEPQQAQIDNTTHQIAKYRTQRNLAFALCGVFLLIALTAIFWPTAVPTASVPEDAVPTETVESPPQEQNYVASVNSNKYHRLNCDYANNILDQNRVYYETTADAERDGKSPCSSCRPDKKTALEQLRGG